LLVWQFVETRRFLETKQPAVAPVVAQEPAEPTIRVVD
jgi:hypothetical protein